LFYQLVSLAGAVLLLVAYGLIQAGRTTATRTSYNVMNFVGASLLTWVAVVDRRVGFVLLESVWAVIALIPLLRGRRPSGG
jgi:hypothetical protein